MWIFHPSNGRLAGRCAVPAASRRRRRCAPVRPGASSRAPAGSLPTFHACSRGAARHTAHHSREIRPMREIHFGSYTEGEHGLSVRPGPSFASVPQARSNCIWETVELRRSTPSRWAPLRLAPSTRAPLRLASARMARGMFARCKSGKLRTSSSSSTKRCTGQHHG